MWLAVIFFITLMLQYDIYARGGAVDKKVQRFSPAFRFSFYYFRPLLPAVVVLLDLTFIWRSALWVPIFLFYIGSEILNYAEGDNQPFFSHRIRRKLLSKRYDSVLLNFSSYLEVHDQYRFQCTGSAALHVFRPSFTVCIAFLLNIRLWQTGWFS